MAECQATWMLAVMAPSRASSLPQGYRVYATPADNQKLVWELYLSHPIEAATRYPSSIRRPPQTSYTRASYTRTCGR
ncbi:hypothetical protein EMIT0196MI5_270041 [Pseudomonas sp. IT-196MI5]